MKVNKLSFIAPENFIGLRLDKALSQLVEVSTRSRAENLITAGHVLVNGINQKSSYKVRPQDQFEISIPIQQDSEIIPLDLPLNILFEDDDIIVLNKPAGLVVHPAAGHEQDTLVNALVHHTKNLSMKFGENRPGIVHRIDRDTSGLLVVAKNDFAHEKLANDFQKKSVHRIYFAISIGKSKQKSGKIQSYLSRHPLDRKKYASARNEARQTITTPNLEDLGKWSVTNYEILKEHISGLSYVKLKLETGRTHQIRIHLSEMGLPIAGDSLYGADKKLKTITSSELRAFISDIPRFALHAAELGFRHPRTNEEMFFQADWPDDLQPYIQKLGFNDIP